jgi:hydrogenase maturation factor
VASVERSIVSNDLPAIGKISPEIFTEVILPRLGRRRSEVLVGPQHGVDTGVVELGDGRVMVTTTDPVFVVPPYGWERSAWFAVHILASDAVTSGLPPQYMTVDLNLPLSVTREQLEALWEVFHRECDRIGMAIVSGHTGRYEGCEFPMIGGATVIAIGAADAYVTPAMARVGDAVIVTKGAAIEAAGLFAVTFPGRVREAYGEAVAREAEEVFWQMSVVEDALTAAAVGVRDDGVTAMHDATECGVWGGLFEVAQASGVGMVVDRDKIIVQEAVRKVCDLFGIDPYSSISEGTLVLTCRPHRAAEVMDRLADRGIPASIVGEAVPPEEGMTVHTGGRSHPLEHPRVDPFWAAFGRAASGG